MYLCVRFMNFSDDTDSSTTDEDTDEPIQGQPGYKPKTNKRPMPPAKKAPPVKRMRPNPAPQAKKSGKRTIPSQILSAKKAPAAKPPGKHHPLPPSSKRVRPNPTKASKHKQPTTDTQTTVSIIILSMAAKESYHDFVDFELSIDPWYTYSKYINILRKTSPYKTYCKIYFIKAV